MRAQLNRISPKNASLLILGGLVLIVGAYALWQGLFHGGEDPSPSSRHPPEVTIYGAKPGDKVKAVATGNFNGDGVSGVLIAADDASPAGRDRAGEAYLLLSPPTRAAVDLVRQPPDVTLQGPRPQGGLGYAVASGDISGDALDDLLLGTFGSGGPGEAYVIYGRERFQKRWDLAERPPDIVIQGGDLGDLFGLEVAITDLDHDGFDDMILGAVRDDGPENARTDAGAVYVIWGHERLRKSYYIGNGDHDLALWGAQDNDNVGFSLASGDLNGDERADLIVGSLGATAMDGKPRAGAAYVLFGRQDFPPEIDLAREQAGLLRLAGAHPQDSLGVALAVGDFNGDGQEDLLVGANQAEGDGKRRGAGRAYALWGPLQEGHWNLAERSASLEIVGGESRGFLGYPLAGGDLNGDGVDEVILGSLSAQDVQGAARAGKVYLLAGRSQWPATLTPGSGPGGRVLGGSDSKDYFGGMLASADIDGDGFFELFVGALGGDGPRNDREGAGEIRLLYGSNTVVEAR